MRRATGRDICAGSCRRSDAGKLAAVLEHVRHLVVVQARLDVTGVSGSPAWAFIRSRIVRRGRRRSSTGPELARCSGQPFGRSAGHSSDAGARDVRDERPPVAVDDRPRGASSRSVRSRLFSPLRVVLAGEDLERPEAQEEDREQREREEPEQRDAERELRREPVRPSTEGRAAGTAANGGRHRRSLVKSSQGGAPRALGRRASGGKSRRRARKRAARSRFSSTLAGSGREHRPRGGLAENEPEGECPERDRTVTTATRRRARGSGRAPVVSP